MSGVPLWFWATVAFVVGTCIGSFLNVVIYRLPIATPELHLNKPKSSFCPNCKRKLTALDLIPLFSFLLLGQKCRGCKQKILWRYFGVELLTGVLFLAMTLFFRNNAANAVAFCAFSAIMVPVFFIDWERFEIPDTLNILATLIPLARDIYGIATHEPGFELLWGWMPRSVLGALVGMAIFGGVRIIGWIWKGVEAMGLGDVLLARGMGAMLAFVVPVGANPVRLHLVWVLGACLSGIIIGVPLVRHRERKIAELLAKSGGTPGQTTSEDEEPLEREGTLYGQIRDVLYCFWLGDLLDYLYLTFINPAQKEEIALQHQEEQWDVPNSAIPFGPFMIVGFFLTLFVGEKAVSAYLTYALPPVKEATAIIRPATGTIAETAASKSSNQKKICVSVPAKGWKS